MPAAGVCEAFLATLEDRAGSRPGKGLQCCSDCTTICNCGSVPIGCSPPPVPACPRGHRLSLPPYPLQEAGASFDRRRLRGSRCGALSRWGPDLIAAPQPPTGREHSPSGREKDLSGLRRELFRVQNAQAGVRNELFGVHAALVRVRRAHSGLQPAHFGAQNEHSGALRSHSRVQRDPLRVQKESGAAEEATALPVDQHRAAR